MTRRLIITLGTHATPRRKAALERLAARAGAIGRNGKASISELISRLADAADYDLERTAGLAGEIMIIAAEAHVLAAEEAQAAAAITVPPVPRLAEKSL